MFGMQSGRLQIMQYLKAYMASYVIPFAAFMVSRVVLRLDLLLYVTTPSAW